MLKSQITPHTRKRYRLSLKLRCVSCKQQKDGFCLRIHSVSLYLFMGKLRPLTFRDIKVHCSLVLVWFGFILCSLGWSFPSRTFCSAGFVDMYCLNLFLSWKILFSPSILIESFAGYSILG
ncbi:hypothetical protein H671_2g6234 [Cricetulus griseus]|uniref:Uncharacterized protein n=1 Tax=Cricetulus griseus TaxID=10029 RepID=A0A061IKC0_CRIGR|nr:hypothetical protein H671_2g6234 [Cricetulus griseus]